MVFSLVTNRLILEDLNENDLVHIQSIANDRKIMKYVFIWLENNEQINDFFQYAISESRKQNRSGYILAVRVKSTFDFAGFLLLEIDTDQPTTAEVGCILRPQFWKSGYATEVLQTLLLFGFDTLKLHRIYGKCDELNLASAHVLEKCGLIYEGTIREHVWLRDHWRSTRYYGMLINEYQKERH